MATAARHPQESAPRRNSPYFAIARAAAENAHGRYQVAWDAVAGASSSFLPFPLRFEKGVAALGSGRAHEAVENFEYCRDSFNGYVVNLPHVDVRVHFYLAQAYEAVGRKSDAAAEYAKFIELWKDADDLFAGEVEDARGRLAALGR